MKRAWKSKLKSCWQYSGNMKRSKSIAEKSFYLKKEEKMCLGNSGNGPLIEMVLVLTKWQELPPVEKRAIIKGGTQNTRRHIQHPFKTSKVDIIHNLKPQNHLQACTLAWMNSPPNPSLAVLCMLRRMDISSLLKESSAMPKTLYLSAFASLSIAHLIFMPIRMLIRLAVPLHVTPLLVFALS